MPNNTVACLHKWYDSGTVGTAPKRTCANCGTWQIKPMDLSDEDWTALARADREPLPTNPRLITATLSYRARLARLNAAPAYADVIAESE